MKVTIRRMQPSARLRALAALITILHVFVAVTPAGAKPPSKPPQAQADLETTMIDWADHVAVGEQFTYRMRVYSHGYDDAPRTIFEDPLPPELMLVSAHSSLGTCTGTTTVTCDLGTIAHYGEVDVYVTVRAQGEGTIVNRSSVTSQSADPNPANNTAEATTQIDRHQDSTGTTCSEELKWLGKGTSGGTCILVGAGGAISVYGAAADPVPLGSWPYYFPSSVRIEVQVTTLNGEVIASCTSESVANGACTGTSSAVVEAGTPLVCRATAFNPQNQSVLGRFGCAAGS